jgi:hypothetical protein
MTEDFVALILKIVLAVRILHYILSVLLSFKNSNKVVNRFMNEKYTVKIINNEKKQIHTQDVSALDAHEAHKSIFEKINCYTDEILEITDQEGNSVYNLKNGFVN